MSGTLRYVSANRAGDTFAVLVLWLLAMARAISMSALGIVRMFVFIQGFSHFLCPLT
jgi:hypothetical protein